MHDAHKRFMRVVILVWRTLYILTAYFIEFNRNSQGLDRTPLTNINSKTTKTIRLTTIFVHNKVSIKIKTKQKYYIIDSCVMLVT